MWAEPTLVKMVEPTMSRVTCRIIIAVSYKGLLKMLENLAKLRRYILVRAAKYYYHVAFTGNAQ